MGIDPAPFWANLYLYSYEESHVTSLMKSDPVSARRYRYASRFIDDQCNLNDAGQFKNSCSTIYPPELHVKCEHEGIHATFLELDISVKNDMFVYKLFDKRDSFPFFIVRMPDLSGNIPDHVFYGSVFWFCILWFCIYGSDFEDSYAETWGLWEVPTVFHRSIHTMLDHVDFLTFNLLSLIPVIHIACGILHIDAPCRQLFRSFSCTL